MTKTLEILAFIAEPKSRQEIEARFGRSDTQIDALVKTGAARSFEAANDHAGQKWARLKVFKFVATGVPYNPDNRPKRVLSEKEREQRRAYNAARYRRLRADMDDGKPFKAAHFCARCGHDEFVRVKP